MRIQQKDRVLQSITALRADNYSYGAIAEKLGMSANTVKSLCKRNGIKPCGGTVKSKLVSGDIFLCKFCGKPITNPWNRKGKVFCSEACRTKYHNELKRQVRLIEKPSKKSIEHNWLTDLINDYDASFLPDYRPRRPPSKTPKGYRRPAQKPGEPGPEKAGLLAPGELSFDDKEVALW